MEKRILIGSIITVAVLIGVLFTSAVGCPTETTSVRSSNLSIDITTNKERFPRIYLDGSYFNVTINITNNGLDTSDEFALWIEMWQSYPDPRIPNEHSLVEFNISLKSGESYSVDFSWNPSIQGFIQFGWFPLCVQIIANNEIVKYKQKSYIIYNPWLFYELINTIEYWLNYFNLIT